MAENPRKIRLDGQRFARWAVLRQAGNTKRGGALWLCRCDCGTERAVLGADLRKGKSVSCGCLRNERAATMNRTHGQSGTRLHNIWSVMLSRTRDVGNPVYGGRGITVCPAWQKFETFRDWALESGYRDDLTIDRVDNDKGYHPQNCRWATAKIQSRNRRFVALTSDGRPGPEVAEENGIPTRTYNVRRSAGWTIDEAATLPYGKLRRPRPRNAKGQFS